MIAAARKNLVLAGAKASRTGSSFEQSLDRTHGMWERLGVASIHRLPVDTCPAPGTVIDMARRIKPGQIRLLSERQGYDFFGTIRGGRSIGVEAKATSEQKTSLAISKSGLKPHQLERLADDINRFDMLGTVLWKNGEQRLFLPPHQVIRSWLDYKAGTRKSIPTGRFVAYAKPEDLLRPEEYLAPLMASEVFVDREKPRAH